MRLSYSKIKPDSTSEGFSKPVEEKAPDSRSDFTIEGQLGENELDLGNMMLSQRKIQVSIPFSTFIFFSAGVLVGLEGSIVV